MDRLIPVRAGQRREKRDDGSDLLISQLAVELRDPHRLDRLPQRRRTAVVEIGRGRSDVTQTGHANQFGLRRAQGMEDAVALKEIASNIDALVASDAAKRLEQLIAGKLVRRDHGNFARKPGIEPASWRDQGKLVARKRIKERS